VQKIIKLHLTKQLTQHSILSLHIFTTIQTQHHINFEMTQAKLQICILQFISNKICARNYVTSYGLISGSNGIFKKSTSYHNKTIIWISFPNPKIEMLTREKSIHLYTKNIQLSETPIELIIKDIGIGKNKSYIVIII